MKSLVAAVMLTTVAVPAFAADAPVAMRGKMLVTATGARLAPVYRVGADGSASIIMDGRMVTVPASTLTLVDGKLTTNLSKGEVGALR